MRRKELIKRAKPILFNTEMVKAILEGRKTVTRRIIKSQPPKGFDYTKSLSNLFYAKFENKDGYLSIAKKPYIAPSTIESENGDILYVRETWAYKEFNHQKIYYAADGELGCINRENGRWRPSIHMKKELARIFLKVEGVRVERLQDMRYSDYINEGLKYKQFEKDIESDFIDLWNSTVKKQDLDKYGWDANPFVWVIEFERIEVE